MNTEIRRAFDIKGMKVPYDSEGRASLTAIWVAAGRPKSKSPAQWLRNDEAKEFIASLESQSGMQKSTPLKTIVGGSNQGTWGHWQIALAYAKWMSPEIHLYVNEGFRQWQQEEKDPGLKLERAHALYTQLGKEDAWIETRFKGICQRKSLTSTLSDHNCKNTAQENPFAEITNTGNLACLGHTAKEFKAKKNLPASASTRDYMERHELAALSFFEAMTEKKIKDTAADGNLQCTTCAREVGQAVKKAIQGLA